MTLGSTGCHPEARPVLTAMLFECGEFAFFKPWRPWVSKLAGGQEGKETASFLSVQKATLGTTGRCPEARSVLHCRAVSSLCSRGFRGLPAGNGKKTPI